MKKHFRPTLQWTICMILHSYWLNSLDYFGSRHSAAFLYLCSHSYPAKPTVVKFSKLNSSLFSESYLWLLLANHTQATYFIYTITHTHLLSSAPYRLSRVSWALAQLSCLGYCLHKTLHVHIYSGFYPYTWGRSLRPVKNRGSFNKVVTC